MTEMKIELRQVSESTSEASMRDHHVLIDEPQEKGGAGRGPMGGELFLASIGGCFMSDVSSNWWNVWGAKIFRINGCWYNRSDTAVDFTLDLVITGLDQIAPRQARYRRFSG
jgi:hypothetical protein